MITNELIKQHTTELANTLIQKNHDYGNSVQEQFKEYGLTSILVRLDDKMRRLKNLRTLTPQVAEESLKDTLKDLSGYALLGLMCLVLEERQSVVDKINDLPSSGDEKIRIGQLTVPKKFLAPVSVLAEDWVENQAMLRKAAKKLQTPPYFDPDDQH